MIRKLILCQRKAFFPFSLKHEVMYIKKRTSNFFASHNFKITFLLNRMNTTVKEKKENIFLNDINTCH